MTRALIVAFHQYTPFGSEFYEPILSSFLASMKKYEDEYDHLYLVDSTWNINPEKIKDLKASIIRVSSHLRYYDAYKFVLPFVQEDLVLFMDNDLVVYEEGIIRGTFLKLEPSLNDSDTYDVVSIIDEIGTYKTDKLKNGNKFCPYWFATRKDLLTNYLDIDWGPHMPHSETLGFLTEAMLNDGVKVCEWEEDKSNILFDGTQDGEKGKDLGYYHIRAGSTPAYLLATRMFGERNTYDDYLKNQPTSELLRHCAWYEYMGGHAHDIWMYLGITQEEWANYCAKFKTYHGL